MSQNSELNTYLDEIASKSSRGEIDWFEINPTTFAWRNRSGSITTIQRATNIRNMVEFQLEVQSAGQPLMLSSADKSYLKESLARVYEAARARADVRAAAVLRKLLE